MNFSSATFSLVENFAYNESVLTSLDEQFLTEDVFNLAMMAYLDDVEN